jgi:Rieske Fe-S protein
MEMNRREFAVLAATAAAATCCGQGSVSADLASGTDVKIVDVGELGGYATDGVFDKFARSDRVLIVRSGNMIHAASASCTHRNCVLRAIESEIRCPCHGSRYAPSGVVLKGPATDPLPRYAISVIDGRIKVRPGETFDLSRWEDPRSFIRTRTEPDQPT